MLEDEWGPANGPHQGNIALFILENKVQLGEKKWKMNFGKLDKKFKSMYSLYSKIGHFLPTGITFTQGVIFRTSYTHWKANSKHYSLALVWSHGFFCFNQFWGPGSQMFSFSQFWS